MMYIYSPKVLIAFSPVKWAVSLKPFSLELSVFIVLTHSLRSHYLQLLSPSGHQSWSQAILSLREWKLNGNNKEWPLYLQFQKSQWGRTFSVVRKLWCLCRRLKHGNMASESYYGASSPKGFTSFSFDFHRNKMCLKPQKSQIYWGSARPCLAGSLGLTIVSQKSCQKSLQAILIFSPNFTKVFVCQTLWDPSTAITAEGFGFVRLSELQFLHLSETPTLGGNQA